MLAHPGDVISILWSAKLSPVSSDSYGQGKTCLLITTTHAGQAMLPWFLRHSDFAARGDFAVFFSHLSQRLKRLFEFNECGVNFAHFGSCLETESFQRSSYRDGQKKL